MNNKCIKTLIAAGMLLLAGIGTYEVQAQNCTPPPVGCTNTDFTNSFLNSSDPNTIEYDNIVSSFHATFARQADGKVIVWGERMAHNGMDDVLTPQELNSTNYPALTGDILKFTASGIDRNKGQYCVLTTNGLFIWGRAGSLVNYGLTDDFRSVVDSVSKLKPLITGMPSGVNPGDVKMLFGSYGTLVITTCGGNVWVLSDRGEKNGDGTPSTDYDSTWHQVKTNAPGNPPLSGVVATRGSANGLIALKSDGTVWTWGNDCYLGDGNPLQSITYATQMTLPPGVTPKMIGATYMPWGFRFDESSPAMSYYLLATDGRLFSIGMNRMRQLGDFTDIERTGWTQVRKSAGVGEYLPPVAWISPQEHSSYQETASISALTTDGTLYSWGNNDRGMLGADTTINAMDPATNLGGLTATDKIIAVETGGHTSIVVKQCSGQYGYVGHRVNGSMGDGVAASDEEPTYNFSETAVVDLCAAPAVANITTDENRVICLSSSFTVTANSNGTFSVPSGNASINMTTGALTVTGEGPVTVVYSSGYTACPTTDTIVFQQRDFGNLSTATYPIASATTLASGKAWLGTTEATSDCGTDVNDGADGLQILSGGSAVSGSGTQASPWVLSGNNTYNFEVTVNGNGTPKPVYWGVWYDVNGDGDFTDAEDVFETGSTAHGSPAFTNVSVAVPVTGSAAGATEGVVRMVATAEAVTFTKDMNGTVQVTNGEVEDFYINYAAPLPVSLISFKATKGSENTVNVAWQTTSEVNSDRFEIERSLDTRAWSFLGEKKGAGDSHTTSNYTFVDARPLQGQSYYRLKMIDRDGTFAYSSISSVVTAAADHNAIVYPNPSTELVQLQNINPANISHVELRDTKGVRIYESHEMSKDGISVKDFTNGLYLLKVTYKDGSHYTHKVVINK